VARSADCEQDSLLAMGGIVGDNVRWKLCAVLLTLVLSDELSAPVAHGQVPATAPVAATQSVLGPGLYVFQTRTRSSSCKDSDRDGYVMSYFAAINGIPGSRTMVMELVNTPHFKTWALQVATDTALTGKSRMGTTPSAPDAQFTVTRDDDRWKGTGFRSYEGKLDGKPVRCRVDYDALLRRIDTRPHQENSTE